MTRRIGEWEIHLVEGDPFRVVPTLWDRHVAAAEYPAGDDGRTREEDQLFVARSAWESMGRVDGLQERLGGDFDAFIKEYLVTVSVPREDDQADPTQRPEEDLSEPSST